jgi:hypothetical protein
MPRCIHTSFSFLTTQTVCCRRHIILSCRSGHEPIPRPDHLSCTSSLHTRRVARGAALRQRLVTRSVRLLLVLAESLGTTPPLSSSFAFLLCDLHPSKQSALTRHLQVGTCGGLVVGDFMSDVTTGSPLPHTLLSGPRWLPVKDERPAASAVNHV